MTSKRVGWHYSRFRRDRGRRAARGRLYDQAFDCWLEAGEYASRPPGERHGPSMPDVGCVVLEVSFPNGVEG
ncbi:MAG: hypothetical protein CV088_16700 [Nitrospira sp. LK70]|nr:hypothetical protein [Nitrospira sp. LK70]